MFSLLLRLEGFKLTAFADSATASKVRAPMIAASFIDLVSEYRSTCCRIFND